MTLDVRALAEDQRRSLQREAGLVVLPRRPAPTTKGNTYMHEQQNQTSQTNSRPSRAREALDRLVAPPSFKEVVIHELKRAAVWAPMLVGAGLTVAWANKKLFFKAL